ncbi:tol-pal system protein YbgF [Propionivibrio sp.]|jgi:tol-pal system protein YbgF|uniref:tol-pal system protein YbgF n=1 Tax=Propionivibrio sp. TaxID=2212460 RepID=UPI0039E57C92
MPARRLRFRPAISAIALLLAVFGTQQARAGLFDDDEARRQVNDLSIKVNERVDTLSKAQIELMNQIQSLREENARLRGQVETLQYELESAKKRQQDFYVDLDGRVRKLETPPAAADTAQADGSAPPPPADAAADKKPSDPAAETREYEAALNLFKANKLKESAAAFEAFAKAHPDSTLAPNAYYWQGNALTAQRDCKRAIDVYRVVVAKWPQNPRAADSLIGVASCQQELGDAKSARTTLEAVLIKYPDSSAAATAKQRLKK